MLIRDVRRENGLDSGPADAAPTIRRELRDGDVEAIVALHERLYSREYGMNEDFVAGVADTLTSAIASGWPQAGAGGIWIVERKGEFAGCVGLTDEGDGLGYIRWVLLDPALRGSGLGKRLVGEAVAQASAAGLTQLKLYTFSDLRAAARIYRGLGFRVVSEEPRTSWGPPITFQRYELALTPRPDPG